MPWVKIVLGILFPKYNDKISNILSIEEQLDEMNEQNESCFIGLALIVIYNNKLYKHLLQSRNDLKFEKVFNDVFEDLRLKKMDIQRISHLDYFLKQHTSYKEEGTYHMR
jgi:hypothetical protein